MKRKYTYSIDNGMEMNQKELADVYCPPSWDKILEIISVFVSQFDRFVFIRNDEFHSRRRTMAIISWGIYPSSRNSEGSPRDMEMLVGRELGRQRIFRSNQLIFSYAISVVSDTIYTTKGGFEYAFTTRESGSMRFHFNCRKLKFRTTDKQLVRLKNNGIRLCCAHESIAIRQFIFLVKGKLKFEFESSDEYIKANQSISIAPGK